MTAADWGVIVALVAVFTGGWFSWRSLTVSSFNQTDAAMLSMKAQLSETTTALAANLRSIAHAIRMTRNAPYTFTSVVKTTDVDGNTESHEYPGLLWITFEGGDSASIEAKRVTLYAFSQAYERTLAAGSQVEFAAAQYRALAERGLGSSAEFLSRHRDILASFAAILGRLLEGPLHWTPSAEDISELGDAGLGFPDPDATELLAAFRIVIPFPSDLASSDIATRHRWARTRLVDGFDELASDALGCIGQVENCVTTVFSAYVTAKGQVWADFDVYMPERWASDPPRRSAAGIPGDLEFALSCNWR